MEMNTNKNEEPRQSTPQNNKSIQSTEYIYSDEKGNLCGGLRVHPEFESLIYPLAREEYFDLEESLKAKGCLDPIKVWQGYIVDGHHRYKICEDKNIPYEVLDMDFDDEWQVKKWMIDNQLGRRNLTDVARIEYASLRVDIVRGIAQRNQEASRFGQKEERSLDSLPHKTRRTLERRSEKHRALVNNAIARNAGVSASTVKRYNYIKHHADEETLKNLREGNLVPFGNKNKKKKLSIDGIYRELKTKEKKNHITPEELEEEVQRVSASSKNLRCGSIEPIRKNNFNDADSKTEEENRGPRPIGEIVKEVMPEIKERLAKKRFTRIITHPIEDLHRYVDPDTVDVIITEPPCEEEDIDLFDKLGDFARHALKDGGICVVIAENRYIIDFMEMLHAHLDFVWLLSLDASAVKYEAPSGVINKLWKPVLIFSKGAPQMKTFSDVKNEVENVVLSFSEIGDVVCDPFCNRGEIAKICLEHKRSIVASDLDIEKTEALKEVLL